MDRDENLQSDFFYLWNLYCLSTLVLNFLMVVGYIMKFVPLNLIVLTRDASADEKIPP